MKVIYYVIVLQIVIILWEKPTWPVETPSDLHRQHRQQKEGDAASGHGRCGRGFDQISPSLLWG